MGFRVRTARSRLLLGHGCRGQLTNAPTGVAEHGKMRSTIPLVVRVNLKLNALSSSGRDVKKRLAVTEYHVLWTC